MGPLDLVSVTPLTQRTRGRRESLRNPGPFLTVHSKIISKQ